jgi:hypothetical protein
LMLLITEIDKVFAVKDSLVHAQSTKVIRC